MFKNYFTFYFAAYKRAVITHLEAKMNTLNSVYRTERLTELLVESQSGMIE